MDANENTHYTLVKIDEGHAMAGECLWQATDSDGEDARLLGLFDDDGDPVTVGSCSWTAIRSDLVPPFVG